MGRILAGEHLYIHCWGGHGRTGTLVAVLLSRLYGLSADAALRFTQAFHDARRFPQGVRSPQTAVQRAQVKRVVNQAVNHSASWGGTVGHTTAQQDDGKPLPSSEPPHIASPPAPSTPFRPASAAPTSARAWAAATRRPSAEVRLGTPPPAEAACYSPTTSRYVRGTSWPMCYPFSPQACVAALAALSHAPTGRTGRRINMERTSPMTVMCAMIGYT